MKWGFKLNYVADHIRNTSHILQSILFCFNQGSDGLTITVDMKTKKRVVREAAKHRKTEKIEYFNKIG